jgi:hypothetical protein
MDTGRTVRVVSVSICVYFLLVLSACANGNTSPSTPTLSLINPTETLVPTYPVSLTPTPTCVDGLSFLSDVTLPDYSIVSTGSSLDKQWLVLNSGSCNWDGRYRLRLVGGDAMGVSTEWSIFPARAGTQATLQMDFTAPQEPGQYFSEWQAFDPQGFPFGDSFFIKIIVQ